MIAQASIIDVETTGFSHTADEVIELGVVLFDFMPATGEVLSVAEEYSGFREPGRSIPPDATRVHGLTLADVRGHRLDEAKVRAMLAASSLVIAHNAKFDQGFVERLFPEAREREWVCSMNGVAWKAKGFPSKGLQELLRAHSLNAEAAHRALDDARNTLRLLSLRQAGGTTYLAELLAGLPGAAGPQAGTLKRTTGRSRRAPYGRP